MPNYLPVTEPDVLSFFERYTRRSLIAGAINVGLGLAFLLFAPRDMTPRIIAITVTVALCMTSMFALVLPLEFKKQYMALGYNSFTRPVLPHPFGIRYQLAAIAPMFPFFGLVFAHNQQVLAGLASFVGFPMTWAGAVILIFGRYGREPTSPCCAKCAYPIDPSAIPTMCPECAAPAPTTSSLTRTPIRRRPIYIWSGAALLIAGIVIGWVAIFKPASVLANLPRPARIAAAASNSDVFQRINTTKLSPAERDNLIDAILDARESARSFQVADQLDWIASLLESGALSPEQTQRYLFEGAELEIIHRPAPGSRETANEVSIRIELPRRGRHSIWFALHTFPTHERPESGQPIQYDLFRVRFTFEQRDRYTYQMPVPEGYEAPTAILANKEPTEVTARILIVVDRIGGPDTAITWHEDGTYTITPEPLAVHEFTATKTIPAAP